MTRQEHDNLVYAIKEAFDIDAPDRPALVARIPIICQDIRSIKNDMKWMKWLGGGFVAAAGLLALKALGV